MIKYVHIDCMITVFLITYSLKFFRFIQFFPDMMSKISNINMQIFAMQQDGGFQTTDFCFGNIKSLPHTINNRVCIHRHFKILEI